VLDKSSSDLDLIRVLNRPETIEAVGVSEKTWERLEALGDVPTKTRLSQGRIGYRVLHIKEWLDRRIQP
jgi:predicted DNA-binding transcriptional regulator AlpA